MCAYAYTKKQFLQFEKDFLTTLNGNLEILPYHFFSYNYFLKFNFNDIDNSEFITAQEQFDKNLYHQCVMILNFLVLDSYIAIRYPTDYVGFISVFLAIIINMPQSYELHGELFNLCLVYAGVRLAMLLETANYRKSIQQFLSCI